jgi:hypothetical protein
MKRILAAAAALALGSALMSPASAAPPTAAPSPGYDARLQQQHAAQGYYAPVYEPGGRHYVPPHRRVKRVHDHVH